MNKQTVKREHLPEVLDPKDITVFWGIGRRQTYELLENPPFHVVRVGRLHKISKKGFLEWFDGANNK